jgi:hypothetical protein
MIFRAEVADPASNLEGLKQQVSGMIQEITRLKGEVEFPLPGAIPPDAKKVDNAFAGMTTRTSIQRF